LLRTPRRTVRQWNLRQPAQERNLMIRRWVAKRLTRGVKRALATLREELAIQARHRAGVRRASQFAAQTGLKLHLGCGSNRKPGWLNIDLFNATADLRLDLRERLPFDDGSVSEIYSEHVLGHFDYPIDARHLLTESLRVLEPGGVFNIGVPDHRLAYAAYANRDHSYFAMRRLRSYLLTEEPTLMHQLNYCVREEGLHKYSYDEETLVKVLESVGFERAARRPFNPALHYERRKHVSTIYVEAYKPERAGAALAASGA
jgi:predicted SAM-dependent methyltransferase